MDAAQVLRLTNITSGGGRLRHSRRGRAGTNSDNAPARISFGCVGGDPQVIGKRITLSSERYDNSDLLRITAYIAWALENTGYYGPAVEQARQFISKHWSGNQGAYTLAVLANFATDYQRDSAFTHQVIQRLLDTRTEKDDQAWWTAEETAVYGRGASATVETTGLSVRALLKSGEAPATAHKALNYVSAHKDASGTWGTTQATIMALRALLLSMEKGSAEARGTVEITLNGKPRRNCCSRRRITISFINSRSKGPISPGRMMSPSTSRAKAAWPTK